MKISNISSCRVVLKIPKAIHLERQKRNKPVYSCAVHTNCNRRRAANGRGFHYHSNEHSTMVLSGASDNVIWAVGPISARMCSRVRGVAVSRLVYGMADGRRQTGAALRHFKKLLSQMNF